MSDFDLWSQKISNNLGVDKKSLVKAKQYTAVFSTKLNVETDGKISKNTKKAPKKQKKDP